ncbi:MAG: caspase family protein [Planctomycetota bacterium]
MRVIHVELILVMLLLVVVGGQYASAQENRRGALKTPGLVIETKTTTAPCNALSFTPDGKCLMAAGADKVVRAWPLEGARLMPDKTVTLRWATWREQRGAIRTMALSPDADAKCVAIGGCGLITGAVIVLDRQTGQVVHALTKPDSSAIVTSIGFSPSGKQLVFGNAAGAVWVWNLEGKENEIIQMTLPTGIADNHIRLAAFLDDQQVMAVARDGTVRRWTLSPRNQPQVASFRLDVQEVECAVLGPDGKWFAVAARDSQGLRSVVELCSVQGAKIRGIPMEEGTAASRLSVDRGGLTLAIVADTVTEQSRLFKPIQSTVRLYDLKERKFRAFRPPCSYLADAVAMHPDGKHMAVAGGNDFEVTLWNTETGLAESEIRGPGRCIWQTAFSSDRRSLGFRWQRSADPRGFNDWGTGAWRVFDLVQRRWAAMPERFQPVLPLETVDGWRVQPDRTNQYLWHVLNGKNQSFDLHFDRFVDVLPRCYAWIRPVGDKPVRLAVGHRWGISLFELRPSGPQRVRIFVGHADDVTSIGLSEDQKYLVSSSRDQTIACFSLEDWPYQAELGASFKIRGEELRVGEVASGSPAWESGLSPGDAITFLAFAAKPVAGGAAAWIDRLRHPEPGKELFFKVARPGQREPIDMLTTVRQRPQWKFFATQDNEWVLWRWRDYFYDTSTNGDFYIGWEINESVRQTPEFHEAERFRRLFHRPDKVVEMFREANFVSERVSIPELLPPKIDIAVRPFRPEQKEIDVDIRLSPRAETKPDQPTHVALWLNNEYQVKPWFPIDKQGKETVKVPRYQLRPGKNVVMAQVRNSAGVRGDSEQLTLLGPSPSKRPRIRGLFVGVQDYSSAVIVNARGAKEGVPNLLFPVSDANKVCEFWQRQGETQLYSAMSAKKLLNKEVCNETLVSALQQVSKNVAPDDLFVLFLAGHGYAKPVGPKAYKPETFCFVCPNFDTSRPYTTGLHLADLSRLLAQIPCRKLVLLDCCHSGSTSTIREVTPDGVGPIILAGCGANEESHDIPFLAHGAFTGALIEALGDRFAVADTDRDGILTVDDLFSYVSKRVPKIVELSRPVLGDDAVQTPAAFIPPTAKKMPIACNL